MPREHAIARYRHWYRALLRLYSRPYRERFAESMEQTFHDLCRERAETGKRLPSFVLWMFVETTAGILRERITLIMTQNLTRRLAVWAVVVALLLLVPVWGNRNVEGWSWGPFDFVFAGMILFGTGVLYELIARKGGNTAYRVAVGIACATGLVLLWINAAVGIIGDEDLANAMYLGVLVVGFLGACIARFEPRGMSRALFATAAAQALVPLIAMTWVPEERFSPGYLRVLVLNVVFVALWVASALLFRHAARPSSKTLEEVRGPGASRDVVAD